MKTDTSKENNADRFMREEQEARLRELLQSGRENGDTAWWKSTTTWFIFLVVAIVVVLCVLWL